MFSFLSWPEIFKSLMDCIREVILFSREDAIARIAAIYDSMRAVINDQAIDISRVAIGKTHNGGGDLRPDSPIFMSCIHEEVRYPMSSVKMKYQGLPVDGAAIVMLSTVVSKGYIDIEVADMKPGILKDLYTAEKIVRIRLCFIKKSRKGLWFLTLATTNELQHFDSVFFKAAAQIAVSQIKQRI